MSDVIRIRKGLEISLKGEAEKTISEIHPRYYALKPTDFRAIFPKLLINEGDAVKTGTPLFYDKNKEKIIFTSPVSGRVAELRRGEKRALLEIVIESDRNDDHIEFGKVKPADLTREEIIDRMLKSGVWPVIRQRPFSKIGDPAVEPKAIFISAFDTAPLAPDFDLIVHGNGEAFQTGLDALARLTKGIVHLNIDAQAGSSKVFINAKNVRINQFSGKHPAGNVGTQIAHLDPINKGDYIWFLRPQEVLHIGRFFMLGHVDATRLFAVTGSEVLKPHYFKAKIGASIEDMVYNNVKGGILRYISGNALTGVKIENDGFVGFYDSQVTILPEGNYHEFFGWAKPGFSKFSFSRTFLSSLRPNRKWRLDTNLHGAERAHVMTGQFEKVFGWNIYPMQLIKAIMIEDIDLMEKLGIYEVEDEDFALCEFIDTSKTDIQAIVRKGLEVMCREMC